MAYELILFDIDGTLIQSPGFAFGCFERAVGAAGNGYDLRQVPLGGKTDRQIMREFMTFRGLSEAQIQADYEAALERYVEIFCAELPSYKIQPCAGVPELLTALQGVPGLQLGLLTGNMAGLVPFKLAAAGIDRALFPAGAFGSDHADRNRLPDIAIARAETLLNKKINRQGVMIVGDTPKDIECARANHLTGVAVATGHHSLAALTAENPDYAFADFQDVQAFLRIVS